MKNFLLRLSSSLILAPIFLVAIYINGFFFKFFLLFVAIFSFYEILANIKQKTLVIFLFFLIFFFIIKFLEIRGDSYENFITCIWLLFIVWLTDIGGYLVGKTFKGRSLSKYSPNKTISGFLGSLLFSQFSILVPIFFLENYKINILIVFIQLFLSLICVAGDIFFSYLKRINNIKDYSNLIPGHGGVLDRIDGMIFVIIIYYFISLKYAL